MKLSYNWAKRYFAMDGLTAEEYINRFHQGGYTLEKTTILRKDDGKVSEDNIVWDIEIPPRRNDLASMCWTAKESSGLFQHYDFHEAVKYQYQSPSDAWRKEMVSERGDWSLHLTLHSRTNDCTLLQGRIINHINMNADTPTQVADEVYALGYEPENIVADLAKYVGRNLGQPVFALDAAKVPYRNLIISNAPEDGSLYYHGKEVKYLKGSLVFSIEGKIVGLAGIFFDDSVVPTSETKGVLILSGVWNPAKVQEVVSYTGIKTFESELSVLGMNYGSVGHAIGNMTGYLYEAADASEIEAETQLTLMDTQRRYGRFRVSKINQVLDSDYSCQEILDALHATQLLGFTTDPEEDEIIVRMTSYRTDQDPCDFATTIMNYLGYDRIGRTL